MRMFSIFKDHHFNSLDECVIDVLKHYLDGRLHGLIYLVMRSRETPNNNGSRVVRFSYLLNESHLSCLTKVV